MAADANERSERFVPGTVQVAFPAPHFASVTLQGEWDISVRSQLKEALRRASERPSVVVDLSRCEFLDSTAIGVLIATEHMLRERGGRLEIVLPGAADVVDRAFDLLGVREVLPVRDSFDEALRSLPSQATPPSTSWLEPSPPLPVD